MRFSGWVILFLILSVGFSSCFEPPTFSIIPNIYNPVLVYSPMNPAVDTTQDSVILTMSFKDGDGDLGIAGDESDDISKFAAQYFYETNGSRLSFFENSTLPQHRSFTDANGFPYTLLAYQDKKTLSPDTLPDFSPPFDCTRWQVLDSAVYDSDGNITAILSTDTVYTTLNHNHNNIFIDIYVRNDATQEFTLFDWSTYYNYPYCNTQGYNGRFPILSSDVSKSGPLEGKLTYAMTSDFWVPVFGQQVLMLKVYIQDRALHRSNILVTQPFTLDGILKH